MIITIGVDRNHGGIVLPLIDGETDGLPPFPPEDGPVVVEDGLTRLPERIVVRGGNEHFRHAIAIEVRGVNVHALFVGTAHQTLVLAKLFVQRAIAVETVRFRFIKAHHAVAVVERVNFKGLVCVGLPERQA